ncbi:MAG: hypothetical protein ACR2LE_03305 [Nocardioidaceae bacterium]
MLQNLRHCVGREEFNAWYEPLQAKMREDELLRYLTTLRNAILKEGSLRTGFSITIEHLNTADVLRLMQYPPPGAKGFFLGDELGGSGWEVVLPDGSTTKYYVQLPDIIQRGITTNLHFPDPPLTHKGQPLSDTSIEALSRLYVDYLDDLLNAAKQRFGH